MSIILKKLISVLLLFCFIFLSAASFAESGGGDEILPQVKIISPYNGTTITLGCEMGINNPYSSKTAVTNLWVEFQDAGFQFERLEFYGDDSLIFTSSEKKNKYEWLVDYGYSLIKKPIKVVCYYAGGIKVESPSVNVSVFVSHMDKHYYKIYGSIILNMPTSEQNALFLKDIKVGYCTLDQNGIFSCLTPSVYIIPVSKKNYLNINLEVPSGMYNCYFEGINMIPGDIEIDGVQDGVINMLDVLQIAKYFNTFKGDANFEESLDFNMDGSINMSEIIAMSKHFGATVPTIKGIR